MFHFKNNCIMKKMMLMLALIPGIIAFVGCEKTPDGPEPGPDTPTVQTFEVSVDAKTRTSVTYSVTPSLSDKEYIAVVKTAISVVGLEDKALAAAVLDAIKTEGAQAGLTVAEQMAKIVRKGTQTGVVMKGLAADTEYVLVVFGVDPESGWEASTEPVVKEFSTESVTKVDCTFDVTATVKMNTVELAVSPSDKNMKWHMFTVTKDMYDSYTDPDGTYRMTKETFFQSYVNSELSQYLSAGYTQADAMAAMFLQGDQSLYAKGLNIQTEYAYMVAGFDIEEDNMFLVTDIAEGTYVTENVAKSDLTFDISVTDVEQMKASILITPSVADETFCWMCQKYDGVQSADEVMEGIVASNKMWLDMGVMLYTGVQDFTGGPESMYKYSIDMPDTEYCVIAFGYAGGVTTDPEMVTFRTLPGGAPEDCVFDVTVNEATTYGMSFMVTPSDITTYYYADIVVPSEYDEELIVSEVENGIQQMVQMQQMFDPNATVTSVIAMYYWNGVQTMDAENLLPDTEYMLFIYALDPNTGKVVGIHKFPAFAKTKPVGNLAPEIELVGYYSGDDEAGQIFGQPEVTAGKSIAVVKYNVAPEATALYSSVAEGDATDLNIYPDADMLAQLKFYWSSMDLTQPYSFFVIGWTVENTVFSYALDENGSDGPLVRKLICPVAEEKRDIAELKALVDQLNGNNTRTCTAAPEMKPASGSKLTARKKDAGVQEIPAGDAPASIARPQIKTGNLMMIDHVSSFWVR